VGERYEREEYFIAGLIMAGELFKEVLDLVEPSLEQPSHGESKGTILLGTVAKDIHDIGKNLFAGSLRGFGFEVIDLGVDVAPETFLEEAKRCRPDIVCLSGLIAAAFDSMKKTVASLRSQEAEFGRRIPVVIGGAIVDGRVCEYVGADSWSTDAMEGVRICEKLASSSGDWPSAHRFDD
jgi:dimethylamine corrinoid protein